MKKLLLLLGLLFVLSSGAFAGVGYNVDLVVGSNGLIELDPTVGYYSKDFNIGIWLGIGNMGTSPGWFLGKTLLSDDKNSTSISIGNAYIGAKLGLSVEQCYAFDSVNTMFGRATYTGNALLMLGYRRML
jgi:hypothetical protein